MRLSVRLIVSFGLLTGLVAASVDMYLPAMPDLAKSLGSTTGQVQQTLSMFLLGAALGQALFGPLADRYGRRNVLLLGTAIFTLASLFCTWAENVEQLTLLRLCQALGATCGAVIVQALIKDMFQREDAARMMSYVMMVMTLIPLLAPMAGGYLLMWWGWQSIFWCLSLCGLAALMLAYFLVPETLTAENRQPLHPRHVVRAYARIARHRRAMGYNLCAGFVFASMFAFITGSPFVYIEYFGVAPHYYGYLFGVNILLMMLCNFFNGRWLNRLGSERLLRTGVSVHVLATIFLLLASVTELGGLIAVMVPCVVAVGVLGLVAANATTAALACFDSHAGTVSGMLGITRMGLGGLSGAAVGILHNGSILVMAAVMLVCALLAWLSLVLLVGPAERRF